MIPNETNQQNIILIVGITRRTGTNLLRDLIALHPEVTTSHAIAEDCLLAPSEHLIKYEKWITEVWGNWGEDSQVQSLRSELYTEFGNSLKNVILKTAEDTNCKYMATKSPVSRNLVLLPSLFPKTPIFVVVRDGKSTVESMTKSFGNSFKEAALFWKNGVRELQKMKSLHTNQRDFHIIKFEDLVNNREATLTNVFKTLQLDWSEDLSDKIEYLPVKGSSDEVAKHNKVVWKETAADSKFDPTSRYKHWSPRTHKKFNKLAGEEQAWLGYKE